MYTSEKKMKGSARSGKAQLICGILGLVIFGAGLISGFSDPELGQHRIIYIILLLPFLWLLWQGIGKRRLREAARRYNSLFQGDADGYLPLAQVSAQTGRSTAQVIKDIETLLRKGYLQGCALELGDRPQVVLQGAGGTPAQTQAVKCPNCGAVNTKRQGFSCTCAYCGTPID